MASALFTIAGPVMNALAFSGTNFIFSKHMDHGEKERKRDNFTLKKLQRAIDEWNEDKMKRIDYINKRLREKNEGRACYQVFAKQIKPLPRESQLSNLYHPSEGQRMVN